MGLGQISEIPHSASFAIYYFLLFVNNQIDVSRSVM